MPTISSVEACQWCAYIRMTNQPLVALFGVVENAELRVFVGDVDSPMGLNRSNGKSAGIGRVKLSKANSQSTKPDNLPLCINTFAGLRSACAKNTRCIENVLFICYHISINGVLELGHT